MGWGSEEVPIGVTRKSGKDVIMASVMIWFHEIAVDLGLKAHGMATE